MLYRDHRGSLEDSMKTVVQLPATKAALIAHLRSGHPFIEFEEVNVQHYVNDARIGWDTWLVTADGRAVGFTNGPVR